MDQDLSFTEPVEVATISMKAACCSAFRNRDSAVAHALENQTQEARPICAVIPVGGQKLRRVESDDRTAEIPRPRTNAQSTEHDNGPGDHESAGKIPRVLSDDNQTTPHGSA